jgi:hypothetical protein
VDVQDQKIEDRSSPLPVVHRDNGTLEDGPPYPL